MNKFFQDSSLGRTSVRQKIARIIVGHAAALLILEGILLYVLWGF